LVSRCFKHLPPRTDDSLGGEPHSLHVQEQTTQYILWVEKPFSLLLPGKKANSQSFHMSKENRPLGTCRQRRLWRKEKGEYVVLGLRLQASSSNVDFTERKLVDADDNINFTPGSSIPPHFLFWRLPVQKNYVISPPRHLNKLELKPSNLNLTGYDGNYAGPAGQTFIGRRQTHTLFTYSVDMDFSPIRVDEEAGITVFLTMVRAFSITVLLMV